MNAPSPVMQDAGKAGAQAHDLSSMSVDELKALRAQLYPDGQNARTKSAIVPPLSNASQAPSKPLDQMSLEELKAYRNQLYPPPELGAGDYIQQAFHSMISSFGEILPSTVDFAGLVGDMVGIAEREDAHAYAETMRKFIREIVPAVEGAEDSFLASTLPGAIGSTASFFIPGLGASKLLSGGGKVADLVARFGTPAALGAIQQGAAQFYEAETAGASEDDAWKAFALGTAVGTSEALPIAQILNRANKTSGGLLRRALIEGTEELLQESGQTIASNAIAQSLYEEDRKLLDGALEGGAAGFLTGMLFSASFSALERGDLPSRKEIEDAPEPEGTASVQAQVDAFTEGRIPAFFLPPGSAKPEGLPDQYELVRDKKGDLYMTPEAKAQFDAFEEEGGNGFDNLGELLGYGTKAKPETPTHVLASRDEQGRLVRGTLVDEADLEGSAAALEAATRTAGPKGRVDTLTMPEGAELLQERAGERATVKTSSLADAGMVHRVLGPGVREVQAPKGLEYLGGYAEERGRRVAFLESDGKPLPRAGFINKTTGTLFLDANAGSNEHLWGLLAHEMTHAFKDSGGDLVSQLQAIAPEALAQFTEQYKARYKETTGNELPASLEGEEGAALLTENLGGFLQFAAQNPGVLEQIGKADRTLLQRVVDAVVAFLDKVGIKLDSSTQRELRRLRDAVASTEFEATADPAVLRDLATTITAALDSSLGEAVPPPVMLLGQGQLGPKELQGPKQPKPKQGPKAPASKPAGPVQKKVTPATPVTGKPLTAAQSKRQRQKANRLRGQGEELRAEGKAAEAVQTEARIPKVKRGEVTQRALPSRAESAIAAYEEGEDVRFALAPPEDSDAFKRWFLDSKVVDADGKPLVVYHGRHKPPLLTLGEIERGVEWDFDEMLTEFPGVSFWVDQADVADAYAGATDRPPAKSGKAGGQIIPAYLSLQNPLVVNLDGKHVGERRTHALRQAKEAGHDGVIFREGEDTPQDYDPYGNRMPLYGDVYVAFSPTQIKSATGNVGTYDPANPDIRYALPAPKAVWGGTRKAFRKNLTAMGNLPQGAFTAKIARDSAANEELVEMEHSIRDFDAAVRKEYGRKPGAENIEAIDAAFKDARKIRDLPNPLQVPVRQMRNHVDALSRRMIDVGVIAGQMEARFGNTDKGRAKAAEAAAQLTEHIQKNLGFYATRSYRVFDDPKWADKVPVEVRDKAKALLRSEYPSRTEAQIEGLIDSLLYEGKAAQSPIALLSRSKLGSKDLSILTKRKSIAPEIRALYGEYNDARINYARSVMKMSHLIANHQFLEEVRAAGLGTFLLETPETRGEESFKVRLASDESSVMFPLNGLYTTPEIEEAFREAVTPEQVPNWLRHYMRANSSVKFAKTIGSPMTHVRNTTGNIGFAVANGHWQFWQAKTAAKGAATNFSLTEAALKDPKKWRAYFKSAIKSGVVHEDARGGEIRDMLRDASRSGPDDFLDQSVMGKVRRFVGLQADIYRSEDDIWKLYAWENEKARYREAYPDMPQAELDAFAANIVRNTYPTYSLVPRFIKKLRRFPLVGNFVSFPWEVMRVTGNTMRQMMSEVASDNKRVKRIGYSRLIGMTIAAGATSTAAAASRFMLGLSDEDDDEARLFMAPWDRNSDILWVGGNKDGNRTWVNLSYSDPYSYLKKPILAFMRGEDVDNAIVEAGTELLSPFFGEEILAAKLIDVQRNTKATGGSIYNPQGSWQEITEDVAEHIGDAFKPGALTSMERIWKGVSDYVEPYGRSYDPQIEAFAVTTGVRINALDIPQSLSFRTSDYSRSLSDATSGLSSVASRRGTVTEAELRDAYEQAEQSRRRLFADMQRSAMAAIALGTPRSEVETVLRSVLSEEKTRAIMRGEYKPYVPSSSFLRSRSRGAPKDVVATYNERRNFLRSLASESR